MVNIYTGFTIVLIIDYQNFGIVFFFYLIAQSLISPILPMVVFIAFAANPEYTRGFNLLITLLLCC